MSKYFEELGCLVEDHLKDIFKGEIKAEVHEEADELIVIIEYDGFKFGYCFDHLTSMRFEGKTDRWIVRRVLEEYGRSWANRIYKKPVCAE